MKAFQDSQVNATGNHKASDELRIAVTLRGKHGDGITHLAARLSSDSIQDFAPRPGEMEHALAVLESHGFTLSGQGAMTISVRGTAQQFEKAFGTKLTEFTMPATGFYSNNAVLFPGDAAPWQPDPQLAGLIDDAYIQWPHIYMDMPKAKAPNVDYYHLSVLQDVPAKLNVSPIHKEGYFGAGVRVAMIDTGFAHSHPFFKSNGFTSTVVLAPSATNRATDPLAHGTGESANIFAIAPKASFIGIKLTDDDNLNGGASILEGFQEALKHKPHVISISMGYDLRAGNGTDQLKSLPNGLKPLEAEIQAAIADGIVVVFSAGNGHYAFPGSMREVISAGGVYVESNGEMKASDYASAFPSAIYSGRNVPDFCGLVGMLPHGDYIMLPVPPESSIDAEGSSHDGTRGDDGWAVFSGTSAAAPQLAAVCALLKEKNPSLTPSEIKALLVRTARDVKGGSANPASDPLRKGVRATVGADGATGAGLIDAYAAWLQA